MTGLSGYHEAMQSTPPPPGRLPVRLRQSFRRYLVAGLATLFPITVTLYLLIKIFQFSDGLLGRLLSRHLGFTLPGLGLVLTAFVLVLVGYISTHLAGRFLFPTLEMWLGRVPVAGKIYPAVKQLTQFLFPKEGEKQTKISRVVLVVYPRPGLYSIGFVTGHSEIPALGSGKVLTILIPTPPSPWSGPIIFAPATEVIPLNMTTEEALKLVVSGGVVSPSLHALSKGKTL